MIELPALLSWLVGQKAVLGRGMDMALPAIVFIGVQGHRHRKIRMQFQQFQQVQLEREVSEERLAMALEGCDAAQWEFDIANERFRLSDRCYEQLGYPPGAFPPTMTAWQALLHPDDAALAERALRQALRPESGSCAGAPGAKPCC